MVTTALYPTSLHDPKAAYLLGKSSLVSVRCGMLKDGIGDGVQFHVITTLSVDIV